VAPMVDGVQTQPVTTEHCPWCSAEIAPALQNCPACGATLVGDSEASLPGVTALDQHALSRAGRAAAAPKRGNRLFSWISGEYEDNFEQPAPPGSLSPPPLEVRREMLRLEIEAETASLRAENDALVAEAALQARELGTAAVIEAPPEPDATPEPTAEQGADPAVPSDDADAAEGRSA
jgi:hypothetical protein